MILIYLAIAILALVGAGAIIAWVRRGDEHLTFGVVLLVLALGFVSLAMFGWTLKSL
jgi:drug/metabolite transporter superfamily protein YnfA